MRICRKSKSILIWYNSCRYHVAVCVVQRWSISRTIWLWLCSTSLVGSVFCCHIYSNKLFRFSKSTLYYSTRFSASLYLYLILSTSTFSFLTPLTHLPTPLPHFRLTFLPFSLSFPPGVSVWEATGGDWYTVMWGNYIFSLFSFSKFNLVLNIPLALIRCPW